MIRRLLSLLPLLALAACSGSRTQILIEVDTDLLVPDQIDEIAIVAESPDGRTQRATAALPPGGPLPRTLGMVYESGPLGPYRVTVTGQREGAAVVSREGALTFVSGETRVWRVDLLATCVGEVCADGETCAVGGCRSIEVGQGELDPWDGVQPFQDAGTFDACVPDERCNGVDDDCDGMTDEGFDLQNDLANCGACGNACEGGNASWSCTAGACAVASCDAPFGDCDGDPRNGCEADTTSDERHCGTCGNACGPPNRVCCASMCARDC